MNGAALWIALLSAAFAFYLYRRLRKLESTIQDGLEVLVSLGEQGVQSTDRRLSSLTGLDSPAVVEAINAYLARYIKESLKNPTPALETRLQRVIDATLTRVLPQCEADLGGTAKEVLEDKLRELTEASCAAPAVGQRLQGISEKLVQSFLAEGDNSTRGAEIRAALEAATHKTLLSVIDELGEYEDEEFDGKVREILLQQPLALTEAEMAKIREVLIEALARSAESLLEDCGEGSEIGEKLESVASTIIAGELGKASLVELERASGLVADALDTRIEEILDDPETYDDVSDQVDRRAEEIVRHELGKLSDATLQGIREKLGERLGEHIADQLDDLDSELRYKFDEEVDELVAELFREEEHRKRLRRIVREALAKYVTENFESLVDDDVEEDIRRKVVEILRK